MIAVLQNTVEDPASIAVMVLAFIFIVGIIVWALAEPDDDDGGFDE